MCRFLSQEVGKNHSYFIALTVQDRPCRPSEFEAPFQTFTKFTHLSKYHLKCVSYNKEDRLPL